jgi:hypothetical protein
MTDGGTCRVCGLSNSHLQHTSTHNVNFGTDLSNNVTISKAEHQYMVSFLQQT